MSENEDIENKALYMPSGLKMKKEYFQGFGKDELIPTVISAFILLIIDSVLFMLGIHNVTVLLFVPLLGATAVAFMQIKGELNLSPVDIIKLEIQFARSQKYYPYFAKDEWKDIE